MTDIVEGLRAYADTADREEVYYAGQDEVRRAADVIERLLQWQTEACEWITKASFGGHPQELIAMFDQRDDLLFRAGREK